MTDSGFDSEHTPHLEVGRPTRTSRRLGQHSSGGEARNSLEDSPRPPHAPEIQESQAGGLKSNSHAHNLLLIASLKNVVFVVFVGGKV